ncbi:MAG: hypothetical protein E6R04_02065 [Spirochaetes bacterium]|nr:MAG: hypothetical protein E6R04_02065 [Spirochaetota bacterium]
MAIKYVTLRMGSGEETVFSVLLLKALKPFATPQEALQSLGNELLEYFFKQLISKHPDCPVKLKKGWVFCPVCGDRLHEFHGELDLFFTWLYRLSTLNRDRYYGELQSWDFFCDITSIVSAKREEILPVEFSAESVLAAAIDPSKVSEPYRELMNAKRSLWKERVTDLWIPEEMVPFVPFHAEFMAEFDEY